MSKPNNGLDISKLAELSNDELKTLWFRCDEFLNDEELELVYSEMSSRGISGKNK